MHDCLIAFILFCGKWGWHGLTSYFKPKVVGWQPLLSSAWLKRQKSHSGLAEENESFLGGAFCFTSFSRVWNLPAQKVVHGKNSKNQVYCIFVYFANIILKWGKPCHWAKNVTVTFPGLPSFHEQMQFCLQGCLFPPSAPSESQNWSQRQCLNSLSELDFVVHVSYVILYAISVRCLSI